MHWVTFVVRDNTESIQSNTNQPIDTIWCGQDTPRFYYEVVDRVIAQILQSVFSIRGKHVYSDVLVISQSGMIVDLLLIKSLYITTIN